VAETGVGANGGLSRREVIKRGALAAGVAVWSGPVIQSVTAPASAASVVVRTCCSCKKANPHRGTVNICAVDHFTCATCVNFCGSVRNVFEFRTGTSCACIPTGARRIPRCAPMPGHTCIRQRCP